MTLQPNLQQSNGRRTQSAATKYTLSPKAVVLFWTKVIRTEDPNACWSWRFVRKTRCLPSRPAIAGMAASKFSYLLLRGPIAKGLWVLHECDNPECVNPAHLYLGTGSDNTRDMYARGRAWMQQPDAATRREWIKEAKERRRRLACL